MNTVADYVPIWKDWCEIKNPAGNACVAYFDTSPQVCRSCQFVLFFMTDSRGDLDDFRFRIDINKKTIAEYKWGTDFFQTIHVIGNVYLRPQDNVIEFIPLSGEGTLGISEVVLLTKVNI